ncbi:hypothetical protein M8C21_018074 [Ambrosia artemisiifolia]|uniref:Uncharacterized protein n=1 Tax=Ambrosia artemisiifolia TaxID=4212 RepID=A0AAD5D1Y9_AMBAR|nr:hypothetical protein M8C21_018074 [Ambrosia artemisiifolia]
MARKRVPLERSPLPADRFAKFRLLVGCNSTFGAAAESALIGLSDRYCVNTQVKDNTDEVDAIFFDEAMTGMIEVACNDMVITLGQDDPYAFPEKILKAINDPKNMSLTAKPNTPLAINSVSPNDQPAKPLPLQPTTDISTQAIRPPATPAKRLYGADKAKQA